MELTLELAKELAEKKWQAIVDNEGNDSNIEELVPELVGMKSECAMCEFVIAQSGLGCPTCIYFITACSTSYSNWVSNACSVTAQGVLDKIKKSNIRN